MPATPEFILPRSAEAEPRTFDDAELDRIERRLERLSIALDSAVALPGTGIRFGADSLLGLIPGVGDLVGLALSGYFLLEAQRLGAPAPVLSRMAMNLAVDAGIGAVPVIGDAFDVFFKANRRNAALLREHVSTLRGRNPKVINPKRSGASK
jgi:hypothetical protein